MRIVIIEDNKPLATGIAHRLRDRGYGVDLLYDGSDADVFLSSEGADLIILDINLPSMDGLEVLRRVRQRNDPTPILMLTARTNTSDRVAGLDAGADDYLVKPFELDELEARVRALSRRRDIAPSAVESIGNLEFDIGSRVLRGGGDVIDLRRRELAAFECLLERRGKLVPKSLLIDQMYGVGADLEDKVVEVPISRLRKKLVGYKVTIKAARGLGYLMDDEI